MSFQQWWKCFGESWSVSSLIFPWLSCSNLYSFLGFALDSFELKDVIALRWCFSWMTSPSDSLVCQGSIWLPEAKESSASGQTEWRTYWNSKMWECRNWWWNHLSIAWVSGLLITGLWSLPMVYDSLELNEFFFCDIEWFDGCFEGHELNEIQKCESVELLWRRHALR